MKNNSINRKLIIGTAQFGMPYGIANQKGQIHNSEIAEILDLSWENGINILDSAKLYGNSEVAIGEYLVKYPKNSWTIITKLSNREIDISEQLKDSTKKLTISPTIVMAHSAQLFLEDEFQKEFSVSINNRKTKVGVSVYTENEINMILSSRFKPDVIQLPMNILDTRLYRNGVINRLHEKRIEIHVRSAFLQGLFYLDESKLNRQFSDAVPYLIKLQSIARKANLTLAELSLLWLIGLEQVSNVVIGVDNASQLKSHLETLKKNVDDYILEEALYIHYENENILNPSLWT